MRYMGSIPILVRALTVALCLGGAIGATITFLLLKETWAWPMPDLAYRFLAGAASGYAVGGTITLIRRRWAESELLLATVAIYGIALGAAVLIEPDPIDWSDPVAWGFVGLVAPAVAISVGTLWLNRNVLAAEPAEPVSPPLRRLLTVLAVASGLAGALVYLVPREAGFVWPWAELGAWKALDSRLLASMLLTICGACALIVWRNRRAMADVFLPMLWAYCLVTSIGLTIHAIDTPAMRTEDFTYIGIFMLVAAGTLVTYLADRVAAGRVQPA